MTKLSPISATYLTLNQYLSSKKAVLGFLWLLRMPQPLSPNEQKCDTHTAMYPDSSSQALQPAHYGWGSVWSLPSSRPGLLSSRQTWPHGFGAEPHDVPSAVALSWCSFACLEFSIWQQLLGNLQRFCTAALGLGLLAVVIEGCFGGTSHSWSCFGTFPVQWHSCRQRSQPCLIQVPEFCLVLSLCTDVFFPTSHLLWIRHWEVDWIMLLFALGLARPWSGSDSYRRVRKMLVLTALTVGNTGTGAPKGLVLCQRDLIVPQKGTSCPGLNPEASNAYWDLKPLKSKELISMPN